MKIFIDVNIFIDVIFKSQMTHFVSTLSEIKLAQLNRALAYALELPPAERPVVSSQMKVITCSHFFWTEC